jgi:hypothetical protein
MLGQGQASDPCKTDSKEMMNIKKHIRIRKIVFYLNKEFRDQQTAY